MANKDYVKRGRGTKKSPSKKASNKSSPRRKPWRSGLIALILLGAFGYGLYTLSNDPEPPTPAAKPVAKPKPKPATVLPKPPEEKWDYVESLPNREVEVQAKEQVISDIPYIMQCGAFKLSQQAEERKANIAFQGIQSEVRKKEGSSWYRVVLGPYTLKRDAERDRHKLQRAKIEPCAIWKESQ
ncbi:SPOR domain-containing protein [Vibrio genomosp. F10]|uniref:Cell division protein FtsN n=1 Tax=Vibrio genomosp. F10 str. ZF-129 TaxID=1187848 RepID=A0A1E5BDG3_9VIBR|nr:SPOR domain-containing protein [Vibrio genomosp. F10]OEE33173.1 cell division protein FtsN [Vibrio genomosp. F10 str. ZF-129]OEE92760.1 cell division protein FtsN [Vibrio genomosp. F10 str. 9ZC157]OEF06188.1 cell division protein FtsN [Vibrio genomosp. F10 str. 9ZB36]